MSAFETALPFPLTVLKIAKHQKRNSKTIQLILPVISPTRTVILAILSSKSSVSQAILLKIIKSKLLYLAKNIENYLTLTSDTVGPSEDKTEDLSV